MGDWMSVIHNLWNQYQHPTDARVYRIRRPQQLEGTSEHPMEKNVHSNIYKITFKWRNEISKVNTTE
jgi:hypothetical protein